LNSVFSSSVWLENEIAIDTAPEIPADGQRGGAAATRSLHAPSKSGEQLQRPSCLLAPCLVPA
jgi:hypothetical protein